MAYFDDLATGTHEYVLIKDRNNCSVPVIFLCSILQNHINLDKKNRQTITCTTLIFFVSLYSKKVTSQINR